MAVVGESVARFVLNQVENRQLFFGESSNRSSQFLQYAASRTAWVKMASGVKLEDTHTNLSYIKNTGINLPQKYVLFNGTSEQVQSNDNEGSLFMRSGIKDEGSYDTSDDNYGIVPMPGIESVDIKAKNRGSIKEAIVKIKCNSRRQFDIIDHLYLRLGYDMLIEYGWSHYITDPVDYSRMGQTLIDYKWFNEDDDSNRGITYWLTQIQKLRVKYNACYDGFYGRVTNFDWSINRNGSYDVTLKLITHGDIIESLTFPISDQNSGGKDITFIKQFLEGNIFKDKALRLCYNDSFFDYGSPESSKPIHIKGHNLLNVTSGIDQLSQHLVNLQFIGRGFENNMLFMMGQHLRTVYNNTEDFVTEGDDELGTEEQDSYDEFKAQFLKEREEFLDFHINPKTDYLNSDIDTFSLLSIGATRNKFLKPYNKSFYSKFLKTNKACAISFYSAITDSRSSNGKSTQDAFTLFTRQEDAKDVAFSIKKYTLTSETYVRFQYILFYLEKYVMPKRKNTDESIISINWKQNIPMYTPQEDFKTNISYDPSRVLVKKYGYNLSNYKEPNVNEDFDILNPFESSEFDVSAFLSTTGIEDAYNQFSVGAGIDATQVQWMDGKNIYLNTNFLLNLLNTSTSGEKEKKIDVYSFVKGICDAINEAFCNVNSLEAVIDDTTNELNIMDMTSFPHKKELFRKLGINFIEPSVGQLLQTYGYRRDQNNQVITNFVRDLQLKSKISKELASMITIGATAKGEIVGTEATAFSKFNKGIINRFEEEYEVPNSSTDPKKTAVDVLNEALKGEDGSGTIDMLGLNWRTGWTTDQTFYVNTLQDVSNKNMSTMNDVFKETEAHTYKATKGGGSPQIGFIPFSLELDLDGISGYKIYNSLNTSLSFLPLNYPRTLEFVLSGVDHKIANNDWVTHLTTIAVPKPVEEKLLRDRPLGNDTDSDIYTGSRIEPEITGSTDSGAGNNDWITPAVAEHRIKEIPGRNDHNPRIQEYHSYAGGSSSDETAWCSSFVSWCLEQQGFKSADSKRSRYYRTAYGGNNGLAWENQLGLDLGPTPSMGCIITLKNSRTATTGGSGHVAFLVGKKVNASGVVTHLWLYGGNQGTKYGPGEVKISEYKVRGNNFQPSPNPAKIGGKYFAGFSIPNPSKQSGALLNYTPKPQGWNHIKEATNYTEAYRNIGITEGFNSINGYCTNCRTSFP